MDLRRAVGHRPLLQVGAGIIVVDGAGRVLLQRRSDNGGWDYAGGSMELGEEIEATARRELLEETGLTARQLELFGVFSGEDMHYIYPNGDEVYNVDVVYICRDYVGKLKAQKGEVDELRFFDADGLPENISPPSRKPLEQWRMAQVG